MGGVGRTAHEGHDVPIDLAPGDLINKEKTDGRGELPETSGSIRCEVDMSASEEGGGGVEGRGGDRSRLVFF